MITHSGAPKSTLARERVRYVATLESEHVRRRLNEPGSGEAIIVYDLEYTAWEGSLARRWGGEVGCEVGERWIARRSDLLKATTNK